MFNWIKEKFAQAQVKAWTERDVDFIGKAGGADNLCNTFFDYFAKDDRMSQLRNGTLPPSRYPMPKSLIGIACIQSMMKARQVMKRVSSEEEKSALDQRLTIAESCFLLSSMMLTFKEFEQGPEAAKQTCSRKMEAGLVGLKKYQATDPDTFPIIVPVEIGPVDRKAVEKYYNRLTKR